jgi:hypothetical protein
MLSRVRPRWYFSRIFQNTRAGSNRIASHARQTTTMEDGAVRADWRAIDVVDDAWANDALPDDGASGPGTKRAGAREKRETTATRKKATATDEANDGRRRAQRCG